VTKKWASLRRFAGYVVDSALDAVKRGHIEIAPHFSNWIYFLPFSPRSLEKVLFYTSVKASYGFMKKDPSYYEITVDEVPGFDSDEIDKVKMAFESMHDLGLAEITSPEKIRLKTDIVNDIIRYVAPYVIRDIDLRDIELEAISYPYRVVSGINSLYVMNKGGRLPSSFTISSGLISPTAYVNKKGIVERKTTISLDEWSTARAHMSGLRVLKDKFDVEYFKAIGMLYVNRVIVKSYPMEISGTIVDLVIAPAYYRYYTLMRERRAKRMRPWRR